MVTFNASFIFGHGREEEFLHWFDEMHQSLGVDDPSRCMVMALRDAHGEAHTQGDAHTVAVQWEFERLGDARDWRDLRFGAVSSDFMKNFGPEAIVFTSIFEQLKIFE